MLPPHPQAEDRDRYADQRGADEEALEADPLDHEAGAGGEKAAGERHQRGEQRVLARRHVLPHQRRHVGDEDDRGERVGETVDRDGDRERPEA